VLHGFEFSWEFYRSEAAPPFFFSLVPWIEVCYKQWVRDGSLSLLRDESKRGFMVDRSIDVLRSQRAFVCTRIFFPPPLSSRSPDAYSAPSLLVLPHVEIFPSDDLASPPFLFPSAGKSVSFPWFKSAAIAIPTFPW